jgi:transposase
LSFGCRWVCLSLKMFARKKKNPNGSFTIQVIDKSSGGYKVVRNFGVANSAEQQESLMKQAHAWISKKTGLLQLDLYNEDKQVEQFLDSIQSLKRQGLELVLGKVFDEIGFNKITDPVFRQLVLYRLVYPVSKLKTTEYLYRYHGVDWDENKVYRYLDKLHRSQKETVQQISYQHTVQVLKGEPQVVFYDVTTVYFEAEQEDDLRQTGFSKEGRHKNPQIVLGFLVSRNGYPLAYDIFEGSKFEGHTLLPVIDAFKVKYQLEKLVIVADAGLLSNHNTALLLDNKYEFILGARIKNESQALQQQILSQKFINGETKTFIKTDGTRLIVSYSAKRAVRDAANRERGLKRLEKQLGKGRLTKKYINNKGYNKYLKLEGDLIISIDYKKYEEDARWDGLKGYITNSTLSNNEVLENYNQLWQIEKAFRVSKTDLKVRPVYHRLPKRIEAHICLVFTAYKVYKELERQLEILQSPVSVNKAIEIAESIFQIEIQTPHSKTTIQKTLLLNEEQKLLAKILQF